MPHCKQHSGDTRSREPKEDWKRPAVRSRWLRGAPRALLETVLDCRPPCCWMRVTTHGGERAPIFLSCLKAHSVTESHQSESKECVGLARTPEHSPVAAFVQAPVLQFSFLSNWNEAENISVNWQCGDRALWDRGPLNFSCTENAALCTLGAHACHIPAPAEGQAKVATLGPTAPSGRCQLH